MKDFFKFLFASCLGVFLAITAIFLVGSAMITSSISKASTPKSPKANSVLHLTFDQAVPEKTNNVDRSGGLTGFDTKDAVGLVDLVNSLEAAKTDDKIKGVFLDLTGLGAGSTTADVIRKALIDFKESEKFIIAFGQYYTQGTYYLASVADRVYLHPLGAIDIRGFSREGMFYKDAVDKFGVKMQTFWAGQFKSASEPWRRNDMSPQAKLQAREYLSALWQNYSTKVADARGISVTELDRIADNYLIRDADDAVTYKLADVVGYRDEVIDDIRNRIGLGEKDKLQLASLKDYYKGAKPDKDYSVKDKIAVVYAEGLINIGKGGTGEIRDGKYTKIISDLRKKDDIKAIVLRVNSPGGSALASENIWRELKLAKEDGKIVVASMGDVAASGGYYISAPAQKIFAEKTTITGSIGVVGALPSFEEGMSEYLGIHTDTVNTGPFAAGISASVRS
ncbi:MAG: signal peptide peptidase SppA, partial [Bacteroidota bacterium]